MFKVNKKLRLDEEDFSNYISSKDIKAIRKKEKKETKRPHPRVRGNE